MLVTAPGIRARLESACHRDHAPALIVVCNGAAMQAPTGGGSRHGVARCGESNPLEGLEPCICVVLWLVNSAYVAGVHTPAKPVCGRHVVGTVVL